jgi:glycerophosphoryl diester phosphodiesterase
MKYFASLIVGQLIFISIILFVLIPFVPFIYNLALSVTGYSYLTNSNMGRFFIHPVTILLLLVLFLVIGVFFLFEVSYLVTFYSLIENGEKPKVIPVVIISIKRLLLSFIHKKFKLIPMVWLAITFSNVPLILFLIKRVRLLRFTAESVLENYFILIPFILVIGLLLFILLRKLFVFQYCLVEGKDYKSANELSCKEKSNKYIRTFFYFIVWNIIISGFVYIIYLISMLVTAIFIIGIPDKSIFIATFLTVNGRMNGFLTILIFCLSTMTNFALFTHLFYQYEKEEKPTISMDKIEVSVFKRVSAYKRLMLICFLIFTSFNVYFVFDVLRNGSPLDYINLNLINVTSHRGFSHDIPENTIPAIEKAIEEQADYIEIDVRQTKDGELVLLHDDNLKRTTGLNKKIWSVTYEEIAELDAGIWLGKEFAGTKIPTLSEVFELCKGKVNLNLDLKYDVNTPGFQEKVVALIEEYEMEWQCVITSTSLTILENVKIMNPDIKTGYITYQLYRGYYNNENIDFFSLNSYFVTENILRDIHEVGKEVHVWTVNSKQEMLRMKRLGVDNIITDNPAYVKGVFYEEESSRLITTLLDIMLEY